MESQSQVMSWTYDKATMTALSDCGNYRISGALNNARVWWSSKDA